MGADVGIVEVVRRAHPRRVRRAIPLAIGMFLYQRTLDHDSLWIFLAAFAVLLPTGKSTARVAAARVISTIVGMLVLSVFGLVGVAGVLFTAAILFVLVGIAYKPTYPVQAGALSAMGRRADPSRDPRATWAPGPHTACSTRCWAARWRSRPCICSGQGTNRTTTTPSQPIEKDDPSNPGTQPANRECDERTSTHYWDTR